MLPPSFTKKRVRSLENWLKGDGRRFLLRKEDVPQKWGKVALQNRIFYSDFNNSLMGGVNYLGRKERVV